MPKVFSKITFSTLLHHMSYDYPTHEVKHVVVAHTVLTLWLKMSKTRSFTLLLCSNEHHCFNLYQPGK